jgi:hypothetical protein
LKSVYSGLERSLGWLLRRVRYPRLMMKTIVAALLSISEDNFEAKSWGCQKWPNNASSGQILRR